MKVDVKNILHSLTGKFILTIGILLVVASTTFWYFLINFYEREHVMDSVRYGLSFGDTVKRSTRYGMLTFNRPMIQQTVEDIGSAEGVIRVRIFDSKGEIFYSSIKIKKEM